MRIEFEIRKLDYRKWCVTLREYFGSQVVSHTWSATSRSKAEQSALREFHALHKNCENYRIIFEVGDE